jgi:hypothetical protein
MKTITLLTFAAVICAFTGCRHDEYVYHNVYRNKVYHHRHAGDTIAGGTTTLHQPGAPETFNAVGGNQ